MDTKNESEINDGIELQNAKRLSFGQIVLGKDVGNLKEHLSMRIENYIDRETIINKILESKNSYYIKDDLIDLQRIPISYITKFYYYFDYVNPLQWITAENIHHFVDDFKQLLHDTAVTSATDAEMKSLVFLPKVKFYDKVMGQLFQSENIATTQNALIQFLVKHVNISIKCPGSGYSNSRDNLFLFFVKKYNNSYRIFTWSQSYRLCQHPDSREEYQASYINVKNLIRRDKNVFYGCWTHERADLELAIGLWIISNLGSAVSTLIVSEMGTSISEMLSGEAYTGEYLKTLAFENFEFYLPIVILFTFISLAQYIIRTLYFNHWKYNRFFSNN